MAYWLGMQMEMFYLACKIVRISLTDGMCPVSGIGMAFMGMAAVEVYGLYELGEVSDPLAQVKREILRCVYTRSWVQPVLRYVIASAAMAKRDG